MQNTTLTQDSFLVVEEDPLSDSVRVLTVQQKAQEVEQREQVRRRCVEVFSSSPLYQARAAKDPKYWDNFSIGIVR